MVAVATLPTPCAAQGDEPVAPDETAIPDADAGDPAQPQTEPAVETDEASVARARELFAEGVELAAAQRWAHAIEAFEQALSLHSAPAIQYNLAAALVESGRYRDAHEQLLAFEADPEAPENLRALSQTLRERLRTEAAQLSIERAPELADAEVVLDTLVVPETMLGASIPVRPGEHRIVATRGAEMVAAVTVMAPASEVTHAVLNPEAIVGPGEPGLLDEPLFWVGVGGGAAVLVTVIIVAVVLGTAGGTEAVEGNFEPGIITWP